MKEQTPQGGRYGSEEIALILRIINNGSISAYTPRRYGGTYSMSKHAILALTKSIALDYREFNITASQIDIGTLGIRAFLSI